jgi:putative transposase
MVSHPRQYRWSSYRTNGEGKASEIITPHEQYDRLGRAAQARQEAYRTLFRAHMDDETVSEIRRATNGGYVLGATRFQEEIARALGRRVVCGKAGRPARNKEESGTQGSLDVR